jgi:hypothetical protein
MTAPAEASRSLRSLSPRERWRKGETQDRIFGVVVILPGRQGRPGTEQEPRELLHLQEMDA